MRSPATQPKMLAAAVVLAALALCGCQTNPVSGDLELNLVPPDQELALGYEAHPQIMYMYDGEYYDPELNRFLGSIVMRLQRCSHRPGLPMDFTMINTSIVNAFATPGHVYATRGFLASVQNEAQFASVMGHELAHVAAGHTASQLSRDRMTGLAAGVAGVAAGDSLLGQMAVTAGQASVVLVGLSYSRGQERQADRVGTYYMALAGYDPNEAIAMQEILARLNKRDASTLDRYLSTHPPGPDRIAGIESVIVDKKLLTGGYIQGDGVFAERWHRRLAHLREVNAAFAHYDRGQKLLKEGKYAEALEAADSAIAAAGDQAQFHRLRGDALMGLGRPREARPAYERALTLDPRYLPGNIGLGAAMMKTGHYAQAEGQFVTVIASLPGHPIGWYGLGTARYGQERYPEAIGPLERAAEDLPREPMVHYRLAVCYDRAGQRAHAYYSYRRAIEAGLGGQERAQAMRRIRELG
jgi:predicted Zn-dependent protease